jgi:hypothetical protein
VPHVAAALAAARELPQLNLDDALELTSDSPSAPAPVVTLDGLGIGSCKAQDVTSETQAVPLPGNTFDRAMAAHLDVLERRIRRLYVRPRALFAEAVVAALIDGTVVEFPAAAWDVEMTLAPGRQPVRIQVKSSGERAPRSPEKIRPPDWGRLTLPKSAKDPRFGVLRAGFNCDVFVFARHEGQDIAAGWHFYVLPESTVTSAVGISPIFDLRRVTSLGAVRCDPGDLRSLIIETVADEPG